MLAMACMLEHCLICAWPATRAGCYPVGWHQRVAGFIKERATIMKKLILASVLASLFAANYAEAEDAKPDYELGFNTGITSDYRFRGISQTRLQPALQGGSDYTSATISITRPACMLAPGCRPSSGPRMRVAAVTLNRIFMPASVVHYRTGSATTLAELATSIRTMDSLACPVLPAPTRANCMDSWAMDPATSSIRTQ